MNEMETKLPKILILFLRFIPSHFAHWQEYLKLSLTYMRNREKTEGGEVAIPMPQMELQQVKYLGLRADSIK